jgi:site-specific DNA-methyltransferase (adenine-specific)
VPGGNTLYYGDNLDVLRQHIPSESVDLIYLDPPFNSNTTYNVLFAEHDGSRAAAQVTAFEDAWHWDQVAVVAYEEAVEQGGVSPMLCALCTPSSVVPTCSPTCR